VWLLGGIQGVPDEDYLKKIFGSSFPGGGFEIYRTADGVKWVSVYNNDEPQLSYVRGFSVFNDRLFVAAGSARGDLGAGGGEIWYTDRTHLEQDNLAPSIADDFYFLFGA